MSEDKTVDFEYAFTIHYADGRTRSCKDGCAVVKITPSDYRKIIKGVIVDGMEINEIPDIENALADMDESIRFMDSWQNLNGSFRNTPLKKPRDITCIEYFLTDDEYRRLKNKENPMAIFDHPEETLTLHRNDGSAVELKVKLGNVWIKDSRKKNSTTRIDEDDFIRMLHI